MNTEDAPPPACPDYGRIMTPNEQLVRWVKGESVHNGATPSQGECCPDFSCCMPELLWPLEQREAFLAANEEGRFNLLVGSLRGVVPNDVHIVGEEQS